EPPKADEPDRDTAATIRACMAEAKRKEAQLEKELEAIAKLECCPTCKASAPGWKDNVKSHIERALDAIREDIVENETHARTHDAAVLAWDLRAKWERENERWELWKRNEAEIADIARARDEASAKA